MPVSANTSGRRQQDEAPTAPRTPPAARRPFFAVSPTLLSIMCNMLQSVATTDARPAMTTLNTKPRAATVMIGDLSERTGVNIETIRYYERVGLLPPPPRSQGRHRLYDDLHRRRLAFIRRSRALGFS